jgi:hypothetical protein
MRDCIQTVLLVLVMLLMVGCAKVDDVVFLNIQMDDNWQEHEKKSDKYADTGLRVFINGNFCQFLRVGSFGGAVDKFLVPGDNTLEIEGVTEQPFEITLVSFTTGHAPLRTIFKQRWPSLVATENPQVSFRLKKTALLPIFDKQNALPDRLTAERELTTTVSNLYQTCITRNKAEFLRTTLAGCAIYSPSEVPALEDGVGSMFEGFQLKPFPGKLNFIHGKNMVFVYSTIAGDAFPPSMVLFESRSANSCSVSGALFAYVGKRWIAW